VCIYCCIMPSCHHPEILRGLIQVATLQFLGSSLVRSLRLGSVDDKGKGEEERCRERCTSHSLVLSLIQGFVCHLCAL
jgi:hypothetical protein